MVDNHAPAKQKGKRSMRILMVLSQYRTKGGEEISADTEAQLLQSAGHDVSYIKVASFNYDFSGILRQSFDIIHVQNFFPYIRPKHFLAFSRSGASVVVSLRNYRMTCITANHWRDAEICEACSFNKLSPGIFHGCYQQSRLKSAAAASIMHRYQTNHTWTKHVSCFIAVSALVREKSLCLTTNRPVFIKPNTVLETSLGFGQDNVVAYIGRLSSEKGIVRFARDWGRTGGSPKLVIAGDGPDRRVIESLSSGSTHIHYLGPVSPSRVLDIMGGAKATICPWEWDEPFGRSLIESLSVGTPVLASEAALQNFRDLGPSLMPLKADHAGAAKRHLQDIDRSPLAFRQNARQVFDKYFSPEENLRLLTEIYQTALQLQKE